MVQTAHSLAEVDLGGHVVIVKLSIAHKPSR
jgi:hypothetical protein